MIPGCATHKLCDLEKNPLVSVGPRFLVCNMGANNTYHAEWRSTKVNQCLSQRELCKCQASLITTLIGQCLKNPLSGIYSWPRAPAQIKTGSSRPCPQKAQTSRGASWLPQDNSITSFYRSPLMWIQPRPAASLLMKMPVKEL